MGSPKKHVKKFSKPSHPWQKERIVAEQELLKEYGLRRKYEIWKMNTILKNFTSQAKKLITTHTEQSAKERSQLLTKLQSLGLLQANSKVEDVLSLGVKDVMNRRLQTLVFKKNLANSLTQARQFIVHQHIVVGDKKITTPSYLVPLSEEKSILFSQSSALADPQHPERVVEEKSKKKPKAEETAEVKEQKPKKKEDKKEAKEKEEKAEAEAKPAEEKKSESKEKKKEAKPEAKEKQEESK